ncbi:hypothetical protein GF373_10325, partial [bacterium]|nr:hypothetical protein [bacterium]
MAQKDNINRRTFMAGCSACMAGLAALAHSDTPLCTLSCKDLEPRVKAKVKLVFSHSDNTRPIWPNIG